MNWLLWTDAHAVTHFGTHIIISMFSSADHISWVYNYTNMEHDSLHNPASSLASYPTEAAIYRISANRSRKRQYTTISWANTSYLSSDRGTKLYAHFKLSSYQPSVTLKSRTNRHTPPPWLLAAGERQPWRRLRQLCGLGSDKHRHQSGD